MDESTRPAGNKDAESDRFRQGFTRFPNEILCHPDAKAKHVAVYVAICSLAPSTITEKGERRYSYASMDRIARRAGSSVRTAHDVMKDLEKWGFIYHVRRGRMQTNLTYVVLAREAFLRDRAKRGEEYARKQEQERHTKVVMLQKRYFNEGMTASECNSQLKQLGVGQEQFVR